LALTAGQLQVLDADTWFRGLPTARRALLLEHATPVRMAEGSRLYGAGDDPNGVWAVVEGQVRLIAYPVSGAEVLIRMLGPGVWFGELSTLDGGPRPQDAIAFGEVLVLNVSPNAVARLGERDPAIWRDLALLSCAHQREALAFIGQRASQPPEVRLAKALLNAADQTGSGILSVRQAELAGLVGVGRQTLNRYLKRFERAGVVTIEYARLGIRDRTRLEELSRRGED
jgi:CRP-like cAMP-binding protein